MSTVSDSLIMATIIECIGPATPAYDPCGRAKLNSYLSNDDSYRVPTKLVNETITVWNTLDIELYPGDVVRIESENRNGRVQDSLWIVAEYLKHAKLT